jgi:carbonic anhydrase
MKTRRLSSFAVPALLAVLALAGCTTTRPSNSCPTWTYANQADWGLLCPAYSECNGPTQSPRSLSLSQGAALPLIETHYTRSAFRVTNKHTDYTIEAKPGADSQNLLVIGQARYRLDEIHFHSPSEHRIGTRSFALEIHLLHKNVNDEKDLAVIAVFMNEVPGAPNNQAFEQILENIDKDEIQMDPTVLLPLREPRLDFRYLGSKTTPPCNAGVHWHVLAQEIAVPPIQVAAYRRLYNNTERHEQRNTETVYEVRPAGATP